MNNYKGSILELNKKHAIVMTDTCNFVTINRQSEMFIGQQILFKQSDISSTGKGYMKQLSLIASVFVLILSSIFFYQIYTPNKVFAYIDVDINPSLEFKIDKNAKVLDIEPLNKDAQILIEELNLVDLPIKQAIAEVIKASKQKGFISVDKENSILISASVEVEEENKLNTPHQKILDDILFQLTDTYSVGFEELNPEIIKVTKKERIEALENNLSMGRYELYTKIKKDNYNISVEKAKTARVSEMLVKAKIKGYEKNKSNGNKSDNEKSNLNKSDSGKTHSNKSDSDKLDSAKPESNNTSNPPVEKKKPDKKYKDKSKNKSWNKTTTTNTYKSTDKVDNNNLIDNTQSPDKKGSLNQGSKSIKNKKPGNLKKNEDAGDKK